MVERCSYKADVGGSKPSAPTDEKGQFGGAILPNWPLVVSGVSVRLRRWCAGCPGRREALGPPGRAALAPWPLERAAVLVKQVENVAPQISTAERWSSRVSSCICGGGPGRYCVGTPIVSN